MSAAGRARSGEMLSRKRVGIGLGGQALSGILMKVWIAEPFGAIGVGELLRLRHLMHASPPS